jgi:cytochrome c oxidase subunit 5b
MVVSRDRPIERCTACGNVIKMDYIGVEDPHRTYVMILCTACTDQYFTDGHPPEKYEPESLADYIKPEYHYR